jgi:CheY-like chemotaxis protein
MDDKMQIGISRSFDKIPFGILYFNKVTPIENSVCIYVNKSSEKIFNRQLKGVQLKNIFPNFTKDDMLILSTKKEFKFDNYSYLVPEDSWFSLNLYITNTDDGIQIIITDKFNRKSLDDIMTIELTTRLVFEMRKAISGIMGSTILLMDTKLTNEQLESINCIKQSEYDMMLIVNDVSDYIKLKSKKANIEFKKFNIKNVIEESISVIQSKALTKNINIILKIHSKTHSQINTDLNYLKKILVKLLTNAVEYSTNNSIVTISVNAVKIEDTQFIRFKVEDTGSGMTDDIKQKIFAQSGFGQSEGLGLSLIICRLICRELGGEIWFTTKLNKGSKFYFTVPNNKTINSERNLKNKRIMIISNKDSDKHIIHKTIKNNGGIVIPVSSVPDANILLEGGMHVDIIFITSELSIKTKIPIVVIGDIHDKYLSIPRPLDEFKILEACHNLIVEDKRFLRNSTINILVVDDSPTNRSVVCKQISKLGYVNIDSVTNGHDALTNMSNKKYDVVFLDIVMPEMSGYEVMEHLVKRHGTEHIPYVIAMTANDFSANKNKCIKYGMKDFISKPITTDGILRVLQNIV